MDLGFILKKLTLCYIFEDNKETRGDIEITRTFSYLTMNMYKTVEMRTKDVAVI